MFAPNFAKGELQVLELDPERTALIIVDMQNDFVRQGAPLEVPDARGTIDNHRKLLKRFRERQRLIVFTRFIAGPARTLIWNWSTVLAPPTCCCWPGFMRSYKDVEGTRDAAATNFKSTNITMALSIAPAYLTASRLVASKL
jgi:nicotinamidase-related amidase